MQRRRAFTLIELLVVITIIAVLTAILLPALGRARTASKLAVCGSNLRQLGGGVHTYAAETGGYVPRGPEPAHDFDFSGNHIATNQLWIGDGSGGFPPANPLQHNGLGTMLENICPNPNVYYCPADDIFNLEEEGPKIGTAADAYGSYIYRQLDRLPEDAAAGILDHMGANEIDQIRVPVEMLAMDTNSLGPGTLRHTNHFGRTVNVLFRDASVRRFANKDDTLAIPAEAYAGPLGILAALDQLLTNADYAYHAGMPWQAPQITPRP